MIKWAGFGDHGDLRDLTKAPDVPRPNSDAALKVPAGEAGEALANNVEKIVLWNACGDVACVRSVRAKPRPLRQLRGGATAS
jgi:hypothetical protein